MRPVRIIRRAVLAFASAMCALSAPSARAQQPRLTIAPFVSRTDPSAIYDHATTFTGPGGAPGTSVERLGVKPATTFGATATFRVAGPWILAAHVATGSSDYHYFQRDESGGLFSQSEQWGDAEVRTASLSVGRRFDALAGLTYLDLFAGGSLQRLSVRSAPGCGAPPGPPSNGSPGTTFGCDAWHRSYSMPGAIGGAQLYRRLTSHFGIHLGGSYSFSRADTKAFWTDLLPQYDQYEAPKSHQVRASQIFLGLGYDR